MRILLSICFFFIASACATGQVSFAPADTVQRYGGYYSTFEIGTFYDVDFDKDGFQDIVFIRHSEVYLKRNLNGTALGEEKLLYRSSRAIYSISNFADVNADTYPDVVVWNRDVIEILHGGTDTLKLAKTITGRAGFYGQLLLLDHNGDSKMDLALRANTRGIDLYSDVNNNQTTFTAVYTSTSLVESINRFMFKDINLDSHLDLVVCPYPKFKVLFGTSSGTYNEVYSKNLSNSLVTFEIEDLNLDGYPDVVYGNNVDGIFTLTYEPASVTPFTEKSLTSDASYYNLNEFAVIDLQKNGTKDIVFHNMFGLSCKKNDGTGSFGTVQTFAENVEFAYKTLAVDFNKDGFEDIISGDMSHFEIFMTNASAAVTQRLSEGYYPDSWDMFMENIDNDAFKDLAIVSRTGDLIVYWGNESGMPGSKSTYPIPLQCYYGGVSDINKDGMPDIIVTQESDNNSINTIGVLEGMGGRQFKAYRDWKYFHNPSKPFFVDVNKDGVMEVGFHERVGQQIVWFDISNTNYNEFYTTTKKTSVSGQSISSLTQADFNKDGYIDLATANTLSKNVSVLTNNKSGNFSELVIPVNKDVYGVGAYDFNRDNYTDILVTTQDNSLNINLLVYLNNTAGGFTYRCSYNLASTLNPEVIDIMDIDADNDQDIVVSSWDYLVASVLLQEKDTVRYIDRPLITSIGQSTRIYADISKDGLPDVITSNFIRGNLYVQLNNTVFEPELQTSAVTTDITTHNGAKFSFNKITNSGRLVIIKKATSLTAKPQDNQYYASNAQYGLGTQFEADAYGAYFGKSDVIDIKGLASETTYTLSVFEYNTNEPQKNIVNYTDKKFEVTFKTRNAPPSIAAIIDQAGRKDESLNLELTIADPDDNFGDFTFSFTSSNENIVKASDIRVTQQNEKTLMQIALLDAGETTITAKVTDGASNADSVQFKIVSIITGTEPDNEYRNAVYPNPFQKVVRIHHAQRAQDLIIYDHLGRIVYTTRTIPDEIDLSGLSPGIYFMRTGSGETFKLVKRT